MKKARTGMSCPMCGDEILGNIHQHFCNTHKNTILDTYDWIKIKRYDEEDLNNSDMDWKQAYVKLLSHHKKETDFLINKIRQLAKIV